MGTTEGYGPAKDEEEMIKLIHHAVDMGVTFLDTAAIYGPFTNEMLVGKAIKEIREKSCSTKQLALAWVIHKGAPFTVPIPGPTTLTNLTSNVGAVAVELSPGEMQALEEAIPVDEVAIPVDDGRVNVTLNLSCRSTF